MKATLMGSADKVAGLLGMQRTIGVRHNVEHIFYEIRDTGEYELWVRRVDEPGRGPALRAGLVAGAPSLVVPEPGSGSLQALGLRFSAPARPEEVASGPGRVG